MVLKIGVHTVNMLIANEGRVGCHVVLLSVGLREGTGRKGLTCWVLAGKRGGRRGCVQLRQSAHAQRRTATILFVDDILHSHSLVPHPLLIRGKPPFVGRHPLVIVVVVVVVNRDRLPVSRRQSRWSESSPVFTTPPEPCQKMLM